MGKRRKAGWVKTEDGNVIHILGDSTMTDETVKALSKIADDYIKYTASQNPKPDDDKATN